MEPVRKREGGRCQPFVGKRAGESWRKRRRRRTVPVSLMEDELRAEEERRVTETLESVQKHRTGNKSSLELT